MAKSIKFKGKTGEMPLEIMEEELSLVLADEPKSGEVVDNFPERIEELKHRAMGTLRSALSACDKYGNPTKTAVDAAKFVYERSSVKDSDEYRRMISDFKKIILGQRKKLE